MTVLFVCSFSILAQTWNMICLRFISSISTVVNSSLHKPTHTSHKKSEIYVALHKCYDFTDGLTQLVGYKGGLCKILIQQPTQPANSQCLSRRKICKLLPPKDT